MGTNGDFTLAALINAAIVALFLLLIGGFF